MNNRRRKEIEKISNTLKDAQSQIETIQSDEQEYYDNIPEGIQESERGEKSSEAIDNLQAAYDSLEEAISSLTDASI